MSRNSFLLQARIRREANELRAAELARLSRLFGAWVRGFFVSGPARRSA